MKRLSLVVFLSLPLLGQVAENANSGYKTKAGRESVARNLEAPDRDERQKPVELVQALSIRPGMTVVDLGTGVGYMLPFLSKAVGESGRVIAEDIQDDFLEKAKAKAAKEKLSNVTFVKGAETDPRLPENSADLILTLDAYHHFDYPDKMLAHIGRALRTGGRLAIVDYYKREGAMPNGRATQHIRLDEDDVIKEVEANGFRLSSRSVHVHNSQYIAIFEKK